MNIGNGRRVKTYLTRRESIMAKITAGFHITKLHLTPTPLSGLRVTIQTSHRRLKSSDQSSNRPHGKTPPTHATVADQETLLDARKQHLMFSL